MVWETRVQSHVESYQRLKKWYLMPPCLTLSIIRHASRVKWSNPGKGEAPSPTPCCSKLSQREPLVTLDYGRQLYFFTFYLSYDLEANWVATRPFLRSRKFKKCNLHVPFVNKEFDWFVFISPRVVALAKRKSQVCPSIHPSHHEII